MFMALSSSIDGPPQRLYVGNADQDRIAVSNGSRCEIQPAVAY